MKTASSFIITRFASLTPPPPPPQFLIKLICSGLLALFLVACSSGSSNSSDSNANTSVQFDFKQSQITVDYKAGLTINPDLIIKNIDKGTISFNSDKPSVATIDSNGLLSIHGAGTAIITAKRSIDSASAIELNATLSLTVNKGEQAPLVFDESFVTTGYSTNKKVVNFATGGTGNGAITYSIDDTNVATINSTNGQLTLKSIGKATVTASKAGNANYSTISNSYELTVNNKKEQPAFSFAQSSITLNYQVGGVTTSNIAQGGAGNGEITYRSDNEAIATVNNKGVVTIKSAGKTKIRATKAEDITYNPTEASYDLTVNKIAQTGFGFAQSTVTATYLPDGTIRHTATGGESEGLVTYDSNNTSVATVNNNGVVTIQGAGTAIITATKAEDTNYQAIASSYVLVVNKAQQTGFGFAKVVFIVAYTTDKKISNIIAQGGQTTGAITYRIDDTSVATIDSTNGVLTLKSTGTATITAMKAGDDDYLPTSATYSLKVMEFTNSALTLGIKNIKFTWNGVTGTDHYRLLSDLGGGFVDASTTGFVVVPNSTNIKQTTARADIALHRYVPLLNSNARLYRLESCDNTNTCSDNAVLNASLTNEKLNDLIGYFKASDAVGGDEFGRSVSLSGDGNTLASSELGNTVYVFVRDSSSAEWTQQAYVKNNVRNDRFGHSVSLSDDGHTLAVGAFIDDSISTGVNSDSKPDDNSNFNAGAAYVFTRSSTGTWNQQAYIKASNTGENDQFGWSVSLSGDGNNLAVSARLEDSNSTGVGGMENNSSATNSGAVYVFTRSGEDWTQQAYIKASNTGVNDRFGESVSLNGDGNALAVGANLEDSNTTVVGGVENNSSATDSGAVYVFTRSGDDWTQQAYIKASNTGAGDQFGFAVSLSSDGNSLAVAAHTEDSNATGVGGAQDNNSTSNSGAVYVFSRSSIGTWSQQAYIKASNSGAGDEFGTAVSLSGDGNSLAVGARFEDSNAKGVGGDQDNENASGSGAVYFFTRSGSTWSQKAYVKASNTRKNDEFGYAVSLSDDGNSLAVGARFEDSSFIKGGVDGQDSGGVDSGAVYLY